MEYYLSTIAADAEDMARTWSAGLEIAEYCTAWNMDQRYSQTHHKVKQKLRGVERRILHGPFNELFPCAIDPKARSLAKERFLQAMALAQTYGAQKLVLHGGYHPLMYYPVWYVSQSEAFWLEFVKEIPEGVTVCLENVLEEEPSMLLDIVKAVRDPRLRLCLDVGHVNAYSKVPLDRWLEEWAPYISHFHVHNNDGSRDSHSALTEGSIPMKELLQRMEALCPQASVTLELMETEPSVRWLMEEGLWNRN